MLYVILLCRCINWVNYILYSKWSYDFVFKWVPLWFHFICYNFGITCNNWHPLIPNVLTFLCCVYCLFILCIGDEWNKPYMIDQHLNSKLWQPPNYVTMRGNFWSNAETRVYKAHYSGEPLPTWSSSFTSSSVLQWLLVGLLMAMVVLILPRIY